MKVLICAHPDDEILWFNPEEFELIAIVFGDFGDGRSGNGRRNALREHPLAERIAHWNLRESNFWRDAKQKGEHDINYNRICASLKSMNLSRKHDQVTTHDANGEYGHSDHILVHNACMATLDCPVNGKDPKLYRKVKALYEKHGCWTWY